MLNQIYGWIAFLGGALVIGSLVAWGHVGQRPERIVYCANHRGAQAISTGWLLQTGAVLCRDGTSERYRGNTQYVAGAHIASNDPLLAIKNVCIAVGSVLVALALLGWLNLFFRPENG